MSTWKISKVYLATFDLWEKWTLCQICRLKPYNRNLVTCMSLPYNFAKQMQSTLFVIYYSSGFHWRPQNLTKSPRCFDTYLKVNKSQKQIMVSWILPKNVRFAEESRSTHFFFEIFWTFVSKFQINFQWVNRFRQSFVAFVKNLNFKRTELPI